MNFKKLNEITDIITKGTTPTTIGYNFTDSGINYIKSEQISNSVKLNYNNKYYISEEANEKLNRSQLCKNDILMSIAGAYLGKLAICNDCDLPANTNQAVGIIRLKNGYNVKYIYYLLLTKNIQNYIRSCNAQSAQPNINLEQIGNIALSLPDISTQQHIVDTVSSILVVFFLNFNYFITYFIISIIIFNKLNHFFIISA